MKTRTITEEILSFHGSANAPEPAIYVVKIVLPTFYELYLNYDEPHHTDPDYYKHGLDGRVWYRLTDETTIQWTLLLAKIYRDKVKVNITINEETFEVLDIQKLEG
ncbi:hypothetical protein [uncultured Microscilla sp.]|uniref:hypothetical protein n=1 Tax=uncultured Microscilla sp. TaxID=432653 RepID=UPI00261D816F|nr:hypothetical protein [uncultured Microscilla sp.]